MAAIQNRASKCIVTWFRDRLQKRRTFASHPHHLPPPAIMGYDDVLNALTMSAVDPMDTAFAARTLISMTKKLSK